MTGKRNTNHNAVTSEMAKRQEACHLAGNEDLTLSVSSADWDRLHVYLIKVKGEAHILKHRRIIGAKSYWNSLV